MTWPAELLDDLHRWVTEAVELPGHQREPGALAARLDVLERIVELLRLRSGRVQNELSMAELLLGGIAVQSDFPGSPSRIATGPSVRGRVESVGYALRPEDLHVGLLLHLLHARDPDTRIGDDLQHFILAIQSHLGPLDVESTETRVMRVATTTRDAARALRLCGLVRSTDHTRRKTWNLTLLGVLCAVELSSLRTVHDLTPATDAERRRIRRGGLGRLAKPVESAVGEFSDPARVRSGLLALCRRDRDVFDSFDRVVSVLASYCARLSRHWTMLDSPRPPRDARDLHALLEQAEEMLQAVDKAVPAESLVDDVRRSLALDELPGLEPSRTR